VANAAATLRAQEVHGSLAARVWSFEPARRSRTVPKVMGDLTSTTAESVALSKALRKVGFRFVGPTTAYAAMESLGVVNDHLSGCSARRACDEERRALTLP
jgi:DNA-3-methyladenine glycosylase I